jgi:LysM repeat protein
MNTPNPLIPQGSLERQPKGKSTVRIAIFTIVSIHAVFFAGLLMQGCRRDDPKTALKTVSDTATNQNTLPPLDQGYYPATQDVATASNPLPAAAQPTATNLSLPLASEPVPAPLPPPAASETPTDAKAYKIVKGDTLKKIATAHGVSLKALTKANPNVDPSKLKVGQTIQVPASSGAAASLGFAEPGKGDAGAGAGGVVHTVRPGETLTRIAKQYGTSVKAIRAANNLKTDRLLVGQKLKLPTTHASTASADATSTSTSSTSKLTATNPAHINPLSSTTGSTNLR